MWNRATFLKTMDHKLRKIFLIYREQTVLLPPHPDPLPHGGRGDRAGTQARSFRLGGEGIKKEPVQYSLSRRRGEGGGVREGRQGAFPYLRKRVFSLWVGLALAALVLGGCAAKQDPFGQQVQRINDVSIQGEQWFSKGNLPRASRDFSRALTMSRSVDYPQGAAQQLNNLGAVALEKGDLQQAADFFTQAYNLNSAQKQWVAASINQANLATVAQKIGDPPAAARRLQAAQEAAQQSQAPPALGRVYLQWASFYLDQNDPAAAADFLNRAQPLATTPELKGTLAHHGGRLALARGDTAQALEQFNQALNIDRSILDRAAMGGDLFFLGEVFKTRGDLSQAWDYYVRAFDVFAGLGRKSQMLKCLERLREVNLKGRLGRPLERFEKLTKPSPS